MKPCEFIRRYSAAAQRDCHRDQLRPLLIQPSIKELAPIEDLVGVYIVQRSHGRQVCKRGHDDLALQRLRPCSRAHNDAIPSSKVFFQVWIMGVHAKPA
jgi:hypothetical protein